MFCHRPLRDALTTTIQAQAFSAVVNCEDVDGEDCFQSQRIIIAPSIDTMSKNALEWRIVNGGRS